MKSSRYSFSVIIALVPFLCSAADTGKIPLAVNDLVGEGVEASEARIISDRLRSELINSYCFRIMERGQMEAILKEQGFQQSGACNDKSCMVEMGQILGVKKIIAGTVGKIGDMYTLSSRMIDVGTGEVQFSVTIDCKCPISELLTKSVPSIARQIVAKIKGDPGPRQERAAPGPGAPARQEQDALAKKKPFLAKWYFWAPAATAVVGSGAVAAYIIIGKKSEKAEQPVGGVEIQW